MAKVKRGYRKGRVVKYGTVEGEKVRAFLYGSKYIEEVILRKMWAFAKREAKRLIWEEQVRIEKSMVVAT